MKICGWARDNLGRAIPIDADLQVEHDGLRLGVCLAIAERLERYPSFTMQGLRKGLTPRQQEAVDRYRSRPA